MKDYAPRVLEPTTTQGLEAHKQLFFVFEDQRMDLLKVTGRCCQ